LNVLGFLIAQLTGANAAQYSVFFLVCHIVSFALFLLLRCQRLARNKGDAGMVAQEPDSAQHGLLI
jgi:hypothetical protein